MGSVLAKKDQRLVLDGLEAQGATIRKATHGYLILYNDQSAMLSGTSSDHRAHLNVRAQLRRMGLTWPLDTQPPKKKDTTMSTTTAIELPRYILEQAATSLGVSVAKLGDIRAAIKQVEDDPTTQLEIKPIHAVLREHGRGYSSSASASRYIGAVLYALGYRPVKQRKAATGFTFTWAFDSGAPLSPFLPKKLPLSHFPDTEVRTEMDRPNGLTAVVEEIQTDFGTETFVKDERMVTHSENDKHDHGDAQDDDEAGFWQGEAERLEAEVVELRQRNERGQQAWDAQAEELAQAKTALDAAIEGQSYQGKAARWWAEACETKEEEVKVWQRGVDEHNDTIRALKEREEALLHEQQLLRERVARQASTITDLQQRVEPVAADDEWWDFDLAAAVNSRDGYTVDEVIADSQLFGLKIRVQASRG